MRAAEAPHHLIDIRWTSEDVRPQPAHRTLVQLEHGPVQQHGLEAVAAEHEPGPAERPRAARPDEPAPTHAEVAPEHERTVEPEQEVLADGLDALEPAPVESLGDPLDRRARVGRLGFDALPDERLKPACGTVQRIALGHAPSVAPPRYRQSVSQRARAAAAGAVAATVWGLLEPLDRRLLRCDYSDVAILGKAITCGPAWRPLGFALHAANGAAFGLAFHQARRHATRPSFTPARLALGMALAEHLAVYPLGWFVDHYHPARGEEGIPPLLTNPRAFLQATWRHVVFGVVLGRLGR